MNERGFVKSDDQIAKNLTPEDVDNALKIIKHLGGNGTIDVEEAADLIVRIEEGAKKISFQSTRLQQQQEERRITRRQFLSQLRNWGVGVATIALAGKGGFFLFDETIGPAAIARKSIEIQNRHKQLEDNYTLSLEPTASSYAGWTVRYANKNQIFIPTNLISDPLIPGTSIKFPAKKLNKLEDTGIIINDHIRTTDGQPTGRLSIITSYTPAGTNSKGYTVAERIIVGEEWILIDKPTGDINPAILAFENKSTGSTVHLSITRSKPVENPTFQLQSYTLKQ